MTSFKFRALTHNDHKLFFEALGEYGKDFQNIQQYMSQKCGKSKAEPIEKTDQIKKEDDKKREQIRNFYNKLYSRLCQLLGKLDDRVEKVTQELYLLINYGEIWKKYGFVFNNKTRRLLDELVHQGYTTIRFKNKNVRLRTPSCKALKKINKIGVDEKVVATRELPKDVLVEFHPASNRDWLKVQSMSQNPRVRANLPIQKRISNILAFLESKWNVSPEKLNHTIDDWLNLPANNQTSEEPMQQNFSTSGHGVNGFIKIGDDCKSLDNNNSILNGSGLDKTQQQANTNESLVRLRLKPSSSHELKEINITRVVPETHLDLSLNAYISRHNASISTAVEAVTKSNQSKEISLNSSENATDDCVLVFDNHELSQGGMSNNSRLPVSLTTPDSSILLERSMTSDQSSLGQIRRHLNILQSVAGTFEGCENSRTVGDDTQDRPMMALSTVDRAGFESRAVSFDEGVPIRGDSIPIMSHSDIPALFDEDAALDNVLNPATSTPDRNNLTQTNQQQQDNQNSKSVDFHIPKNLTLGDWLNKMTGQSSGGDNANEPFSVREEARGAVPDIAAEHVDVKYNDNPVEEIKIKPDPIGTTLQKSNNHMIEIEKIAEGWTLQDDSSITVGELYLAFECPDKIVLEYEFESFTPSENLPQDTQDTNHTICKNTLHDDTTIPKANPSNDTLIFKLLSAASLSLEQIERHKQEQDHKLIDQPVPKRQRRRPGVPSNPNTIKYLERCALLKNKPETGQQVDQESGSNNDQAPSKDQPDVKNYSNWNQRRSLSQGQDMTEDEIKAHNKRVGDYLKQLNSTKSRIRVLRPVGR